MTNTQQFLTESVVDQRPNHHHHHHQEETVQLTELKPVEHSRINGIGTLDDKDEDNYATDGLKALRSFSHRERQQQVEDEFEQFGSGYPKKRKVERWRQHIEFDVGVDDFSKKKQKKLEYGKKDSDEDIEDVDEDDYYGVNGDFEYLNENSSEIYVYKQPDEEKEEKEENCVPVNLAAKETPAVVKRPRGRPPKKKKQVIVKKKTTKNNVEEQKEEKTTCNKEEITVELELQSKINELIKANILMEQENNNNNININVDEAKNFSSSKMSSKGSNTNNNENTMKKYTCEFCDAVFKGSGGLRNHLKVVHSTGPLFKCDECGKEFPLKERLKLHVRTHTGFKPYKCDQCDKSFARGGQLVQHRRTHSQVKPYSCDLCPGTFTCAANLALHLKRHNNQKDHKCDICGRGFVRRDALKKHLECLHRDVKSFLCVICNKTFKGHLPQHMRTHAQDRPHGCATCGQRFAQKSQLTVHQRTHSGQRPFRCLVCWQAFAHSTALKLHTRRHTGERPFKCTECNAGFTQLPHWKKHMKCIHGRNEPYSCRFCNTFFRIKSELEIHEQDCGESNANNNNNNNNNNNDEDDDKDKDDLLDLTSNCSNSSNSTCSGSAAVRRYRNMSIEKMRLLLAVLLKRISKQERLDELGFGKRLIDDVLIDSLISAGKTVVKPKDFSMEFEALQRNVEVFLEWTVPKEHWENFRRLKKTPEDVLEALTAT